MSDIQANEENVEPAAFGFEGVAVDEADMRKADAN